MVLTTEITVFQLLLTVHLDSPYRKRAKIPRMINLQSLPPGRRSAKHRPRRKLLTRSWRLNLWCEGQKCKLYKEKLNLIRKQYNLYVLRKIRIINIMKTLVRLKFSRKLGNLLNVYSLTWDTVMIVAENTNSSKSILFLANVESAIRVLLDWSSYMDWAIFHFLATSENTK